ncbi:hypothetical protein LXL04_013942 [Taraxacum kok-saghyz]
MYAMWEISKSKKLLDAAAIYEGYPTFFSITLHHGGKFTKFTRRTYIDGKVDYVNFIDMDEFSVHELDYMMQQLGYKVPPVINYHFQIPNGDFDFGLRALGNDLDVLTLAKFIEDNKVIHVYTEHGETRLLTYFMSPRVKPRVVIEELDNVDAMDNLNHEKEGERLDLSLVLFRSPEYSKQRKANHGKGSSSSRKRLCFNAQEDLNVQDEVLVSAPVNLSDDMDMEQNIQVPLVDPVHDAVDDANAQEIDEANEQDYMNVQEPDEVLIQSYDFDNFDPFFGDTLNANRETEAAREKGGNDSEHEAAGEEDGGDERHESEHEGSGEEGGDESDESDIDFIVDEENYVSDVEVDMSDFHLNIDLDAEYVERSTPTEQDEEGDIEDVEVIDNDEWDSVAEDSADEKRKSLLKQLRKEKRCSHGVVHAAPFYVVRLRVECRGKVPEAGGSDGGVGGSTTSNKLKCSWSMQCSRSQDSDWWYVKTLKENHTCLQTRKLRACTAKFISKEIIDQVESNPTVPLRSIQDQVQKKLQIGVSIYKIQRAKASATMEVVGDYTKQYQVLRDYLLEVQVTNEGTTVKLDVVSDPNLSNTNRQFKRVYICLGSLKKGFKAGVREFLGLDGAFMKGPFPGQILIVVGVDSNNGIYPVAYAIVEAENRHSWTWFLQCLQDDLDLYSNSNFTFISDRQKGILQAVSQVFPQTEHRFCLRHIHENMRKFWKTTEYKDHLWKCSAATTVPEFEKCMTELSHFDREAFEWLKKIPPEHWARSHFSGRVGTDMVLNNLCEVFNSKLVQGRDKPIISFLEFIRQYLMKRICNVMKVMDKAQGPLTPTGSKLLEKNRLESVQYRARWNDTAKYEVYGPWHDQHVVDMGEMTCTCSKWELNGIPCKHAIATIHEMGDSGERVGELYTYVNKVYLLSTWREAYSYKVEPIKGRVMWPKSNCPFTLTPPPHHTQPGRPKVKRKRSADEKSLSQSQGKRLTRKFVSVRCGKCKNRGHNSRSCKGQGGN